MQLQCAVIGEGTVFAVEVVLDVEDVEWLREAIANRYQVVSSLVQVYPARLKLYLARKKGKTEWMKHTDALTDFFRSGIVSEEYEEMLSSWRLNHPELFGPKYRVGNGDIHVLVELPDTQQSPPTLTQLMPPVDQGWTARWLQEFRMSRIALHALPLVGELADFAGRELPVKISLHECIREHWLAKMETPSPELMDKLFRVSNGEPCIEFLNQVGYRVVEPVDAEGSFVSFWDDLIRHVLDFVGIGKSDRSPGRSPSTSSSQPDFLFFVDSVCVFRGMEESMETPRRELFEQLVWNFGGVPYLFGYAAGGYEARLYAITHAHGSVDAVELGVYNAKHLEGRLRLLLAVLNITRLLQSIVSLCPHSARNEYKKMYRDHGVKVLLEPTCVVKCFPQALFPRAKDHAEAVYKVLAENAVPNVDHLHRVHQHANRLVFKPRGQERRPSTLVELFHAVASVLRALVKLHTASWMHRDIRWSNVINGGGSSWFLIDFMDAAQSPQLSPSGSHLSQAEHAPEIFRDETHTTAVDVWSVGRLIGGEVLGSWYDFGGERTQFLELLMHRDPSRRPTAVAALDRLCQLEREHLAGSYCES